MKLLDLNENWFRFFARSDPLSLTKTADEAAHPSLGRSESWRGQMAILLPLAYLWYCVIDSLWYDWTTDPQYSYGCVVPFLCLGLLVRRWWGFGDGPGLRPRIVQNERSGTCFILITAVVLAGLFLPIRLVEGAVPEWRPIQWALGIAAVGLTLCAVDLAKGRVWFRWLAFPVCFFLISVPWPTFLERAIIQPLTRCNSMVVVDLLGWLGIPAVPHGNVIEISTGIVGINDACSGIRSLQASLMISLFFGEFYALSGICRVWLLSLGFILAMALNAGRMLLLTVVAARKGIAAISLYHDPAGVSSMLLCVIGLWGLAVFLGRKSVLAARRQSAGDGTSPPADGREPRWASLPRLAFGLLIWLAAVDLGVYLWYRTLESHLAPSPKWSLAFPTNNPTFKTDPISTDTASALRFDEGKQGLWAEADGSIWKAFYFSWQPGRVAGYLAKRHTPEACLPATGGNILSDPKLTLMNVKNIILPVRSYEFKMEGRFWYVFQSRWEAGTRPENYREQDSTRYSLIRGIWAGRGDKGQKVLEFAVAGCPSADAAKAALNVQLQKLLIIDSAD